MPSPSHMPVEICCVWCYEFAWDKFLFCSGQSGGWTAPLSESLALCLMEVTMRARMLKSLMYLHKLRLSISTFFWDLGMLVEGLEGGLEGKGPSSARSVWCSAVSWTCLALIIHACTEISWGPGWALLKDVKIAYSGSNKTWLLCFPPVRGTLLLFL